MPCRLVRSEENSKFRDYTSSTVKGGSSGKGMGAFVKDLKDEFKTVESVYLWHAFTGYWGGLRPDDVGGHMPECRVIKPKLSEGFRDDNGGFGCGEDSEPWGRVGPTREGTGHV